MVKHMKANHQNSLNKFYQFVQEEKPNKDEVEEPIRVEEPDVSNKYKCRYCSNTTDSVALMKSHHLLFHSHLHFNPPKEYNDSLLSPNRLPTARKTFPQSSPSKSRPGCDQKRTVPISNFTASPPDLSSRIRIFRKSSSSSGSSAIARKSSRARPFVIYSDLEDEFGEPENSSKIHNRIISKSDSDKSETSSKVSETSFKVSETSSKVQNLIISKSGSSIKSHFSGSYVDDQRQKLVEPSSASALQKLVEPPSYLSAYTGGRGLCVDPKIYEGITTTVDIHGAGVPTKIPVANLHTFYNIQPIVKVRDYYLDNSNESQDIV